LLLRCDVKAASLALKDRASLDANTDMGSL